VPSFGGSDKTGGRMRGPVSKSRICLVRGRIVAAQLHGQDSAIGSCSVNDPLSHDLPPVLIR